MGKAFFNGWELWQKMTFVLGVCIFLVFCIAYGKLVWVNRFVRRQEVIDEEKRTRIEELRQSGLLVEAPKSHDIPFGVRAIQSGIQVDGIWISNTNTPVTSELRVKQQSGDSSGDTTDINSSKDSGAAVKLKASSPHKPRPSSRQGRPLAPRNYTGGSVIENIDVQSAGNRQSYQPRKSSHLRYNSAGAYNEETLGQLEGKSPPKKKLSTHRPRGSRQIYSEAESSAADNERNSATSSDSDANFFETHHSVNSAATLQNHPTVPMIQNTDYYTIPSDSPAHESSDPFASPPEASLSSRRPSAQRVTSWYDDAHQNDSNAPFVPGELHMNKTARKVNSGFEVLPAGTFGAPAEHKGKGVDRGSGVSDDGERRPSNKLQKKGNS